ncbi:sulfite exporter TauE/SafE family protein [Methylomonas sp. HYX-M1]|uniref:sulfite exporter TauE/SafE family protein n=1 Tax=Methylomonas sp. HYX-M1 TaxID=3139307 RepID=UPI00345B7E00
MLLTLLLSLVIGLLLGLLGGGGSILTVPMLVYLLGVPAKTAITTSFVVVGLSSIIALIPHARRHSVCWKSGLFFGLSGMVGAFGGGRLAGLFSADWLMTLFGLICIATGIMMLRGKKAERSASKAAAIVSVCPLTVPYRRVLFDGLLVGGLTGMIGVGGGFLIVPALALWVGLPMHGAIGTSLLVIIMNALAGLAGYSQHAELDLDLTIIVSAGALVGSALGAGISGFINEAKLRRAFGVTVVAIGVYVLTQSVSEDLIASSEVWLENIGHSIGLVFGLAGLAILIRFGRWLHTLENVNFSGKHSADRQ